MLKIRYKFLLLVLTLATIAPDFRRAENDQGLLIIVLGLMNVFFGLMLIFDLRKVRRHTLLAVLPVLLFLGASLISGILNDQAVRRVLSNGFPLVNFAVALVAFAEFSRNEKEASELIQALLFGAVASVVFKLMFAFSYYNLSLEDARYQVLSGAIPLLFSYSVAGLILGRTRFALMSLALVFSAVFISVTRTYLLVFAVAYAAVLVSLPLSGMIRSLKRVGLYLALVVLGSVVIFFSMPEVLDRWLSRLGAESKFGFDLTAATRIAEAHFQVQELGRNTLHLLFGFGQGAETRMSGYSAQLVQSVLGTDAVTWQGSGYGHNLYVGMFYVGGVIFGAILFSFLVYIAGYGLIGAKKACSRGGSSRQQFLAVWGFSSFCGYLTFALLSGTLGNRSYSFFFGVSAGLILIRRYSKGESRCNAALGSM